MKLNRTGVINLYRQHLKDKNYSSKTIERHAYSISLFFIWLEDDRNITDLREVWCKDILSFTCHLNTACKQRGGTGYKKSSQKGIILDVQKLFSFLYRRDYILVNPFEQLDLTMQKLYSDRKSIPVKIMNTFLDSIKGKDIYSIRDRGLFELLYGTGLRASELCALNLTDIDLQAGTLTVREGKGRKDRVVPMGRHLINYLKQYIQHSRAVLIKGITKIEDQNALFINRRGTRFTIYLLYNRLQKKLKDSGLKNVTMNLHQFRHSFATHMLENGARIKHVKDILGHTSIETTVLYTHFSVGSLRRIIKQHHPRENELYKDFFEEQEELYKILIDLSGSM